jgi:uncharacterized repeat protein (TIGR02543 family)
MKRYFRIGILILFGVFINLLISCQNSSYTFIYNLENNTESITLYDNEINHYQFMKPSKKGYIFDGWYLDEGLNLKYNNEIPDEKTLNLYPKWKENEYKFRFITNSESFITPINIKGSEVKNYKFEEPIKEGYSFDGWYKDQELTLKYENEIPRENTIILYAKYNSNKYKLNIIENDNKQELLFDYNSKIELPLLEKKDIS